MHLSNIEGQDTRGVCVYVSNKCKSIQLHKNKNYNDAVWVNISGDKSKEKVLFGCIYRSGTPTTAAKYDEEFNKMLIEMSNLPNYTFKYCFGDFNYNKIQWTPDPIPPNENAVDTAELKFVECIRDTYMYQHISKPTRYREGNRPTIDDLIFSSEANSVTSVTHLSSLGKSDHEAIQCKINIKPVTRKNTKATYCYDRGDYEKMRNMLNIDWNQSLSSLSTQEAMDKVEKLYKDAMEKCIPKKTTPSSSHRKKPLWMNKTALKKCRKKHSAWIRYLNTKSGEDYANYIQERNKANKEVRKSRREYEKKLAAECKKNSKCVWSYIRNQRKSGNAMPDLKRKDGTYTTNDKEAADALNEQYFDTFTAEDINSIPHIDPKPLLTSQLKDFNVNIERVLKVVRGLKINKSPGIDGFHPRVIKELDTIIADPITIIYMKSIEESVVPSQWKDAEITPIFKKAERHLPQNYRPVSLTSVICKMLEKLVVEDIVNHVKMNHLNCKQQHGFTTCKCTSTNLLEVLNVITEAQMHGIPVDILFLDYQKAFDTVPHQRLLKQIESFGISDKALKWIQSFLNNRRQRVRVNNETSEWKPVLSGIPQGSILGPILFTLYVNDIPDKLKSIIAMYADDTKLLSTITSDNPKNDLSVDLETLEEWANMFQMKFHPDKCHVMHIGANNPRVDYTMSKENTRHTLEKVSVEKDLGILIDDKLKFSDHINTKVNKANQILGCLKHTFKHITKDILKLLYTSLIRPHLEYGSCVWNPHLKKDQDAIERIQRRATKLVPELRNLSYSERLKALNLPTLKFRRERADLIETYNILTGKHEINKHCRCSHCPNKEMFQQSLATTTRGHSMKLQSQKVSGIRYHFLADRVVNNWNKLPEAAVSQPTLQKFKTEIHKQWSDTDYYQYNFSY